MHSFLCVYNTNTFMEHGLIVTNCSLTRLDQDNLSTIDQVYLSTTLFPSLWSALSSDYLPSA